MTVSYFAFFVPVAATAVLRFHVPQSDPVGGGDRSLSFLILPTLFTMGPCCRRAAFNDFVPIVFYSNRTVTDRLFSGTPLDMLPLLPLGLHRHQVHTSPDDGSLSPPPLMGFDPPVYDGSLSPPPLILLEDIAE